MDAPVILRKGRDGLAMLGREQPDTDPCCGALLAFRSKHAERLKLLFFDRTGIVLVSKKLNAGEFSNAKAPL